MKSTRLNYILNSTIIRCNYNRECLDVKTIKCESKYTLINEDGEWYLILRNENKFDFLKWNLHK